MTSETGAAACTLLEAVQLTTDRDQRIITVSVTHARVMTSKTMMKCTEEHLDTKTGIQWVLR